MLHFLVKNYNLHNKICYQNISLKQEINLNQLLPVTMAKNLTFVL